MNVCRYWTENFDLKFKLRKETEYLEPENNSPIFSRSVMRGGGGVAGLRGYAIKKKIRSMVLFDV